MRPPQQDEKILLVPTDFSESSARALELARELAPRLDAEVVLAHVYGVPQYAYPSGTPVPLEELQREFAAAARMSLAELAARAGGLRTVLREGAPEVELLALIEALRPVLVVVGLPARRGFARLRCGSGLERIVRRSPSPVLTVREPEAT